jgi:hypothetical protein
MENNDESQSGLKRNLSIIDLPITTSTFTWVPIGSLLYIILHIISLMMPLVMIMTFFDIAMDGQILHWRLALIWVDVLAWWGSYILSTLFFGKIFLIILKLFHVPKEGLFKAEKSDRDYYYYCLRVTVKKFIFWTWNNFCFPWATNAAFKLCDMRADFKSSMFDGWTDVEFIEFGNNMMVGQGAVVLSSIIIRIDNEDYFLIKKVIMGDHVVLGGHAIVAPGTIIGESTTLGIWSITHIGQVLEPKYIYIGQPARKYQPINKAIEYSRKVRVRRIVDTGEKVPYDIPIYSLEVAKEDEEK